MATIRGNSLLLAEFGSSNKFQNKKIRGAQSRHVFIYSTIQEKDSGVTI